MIRIGFLYFTLACCCAGCGSAAVVTDVVPEPMQTVAEVMEEPLPNEADVEMLAKLVWGEARGCSTTEQAAVIWTVLNRVDSEEPYFPHTIQEVVTQPNQFHGYHPNHPVEQDKVELAIDVLTRWLNGGEGRVLPKEYVFFHGDGLHNYFRIEYQHNGQYWDWSLDSPYVEE
jgi:hypothetical protein